MKIDKDTAIRLADESGIPVAITGGNITKDQVEHLCNLAVEHYIKKTVEELTTYTTADGNFCSTHPDAPHGFARNASHAEDRYVCECEGWVPEESKCWCTTCNPITMDNMRFVVCPDCGNKRCPKAHNHAMPCFGSNEVGQIGSSWENVKRQRM